MTFFFYHFWYLTFLRVLPYRPMYTYNKIFSYPLFLSSVIHEVCTESMCHQVWFVWINNVSHRQYKQLYSIMHKTLDSEHQPAHIGTGALLCMLVITGN